jgi:translation initiation factor IF-3
MASESGLDLVEVAAKARPPVVRLMDYGRYRYQQQRKEREARRKTQKVDVKEIQLGLRTEDHDFQVKVKRARRFLKEGNVVKVVVRFKGRELRRPELGVEAMDRILGAMADIATIEFRSRTIQGRRLVARMEPSSQKGRH